MVSPGGAAVFVGLGGSVIGLLLGHAVSRFRRRQSADPVLNEAFAETARPPRRISPEG